MKRYEKMTKDEIIKSLSTIGDCDVCVAEQYCHGVMCGGEGWRLWLNEEITLKPRFTTLKTAEEMTEEVYKFQHNVCMAHSCNGCKYDNDIGSDVCFAKYLNELVEVEDDA